MPFGQYIGNITLDRCHNVWYRESLWNITLEDETTDFLNYEHILASVQSLQQVDANASDGGCVEWDYPIQDEDVEQYLKLNTRGCGPSHDCPTACSTVEGAFSDPGTLSNCVLLPVIESLYDHNLLTPSALAGAHAMGINDTSQRTDTDNGSPLVACLSSVNDDNSTYAILHLTDADGLSYFCPGICSTLRPELNADVGGLGIYTSYYIQLAIVITCGDGHERTAP